MEIKNKFNVGDEVYTIVTAPIRYKCPVCGGIGSVKYNLIKNCRAFDLKCPNCYGSGEEYSNKTIYEVSQGLLKITKLTVNITNISGENNIHYKYKLRKLYESNSECNINHREESDLFLNKEDAQKRCDELNKPKIISEEVEGK